MAISVPLGLPNNPWVRNMELFKQRIQFVHINLFEVELVSSYDPIIMYLINFL